MCNYNIIHLDMGDTLIVHVTDEVSVTEVEQIYNYLQKVFPNNNICMLQDYLVSGLTVVKNEDLNKNIFLQE